VRGNLPAVLIKSLTKSQVALIEIVFIHQASQRSTFPSPVDHHHFPVPLNHSHTRRRTRMAPRMLLGRRSLMRRPATAAKSRHVGQVTINMLPNEVLLEVFDFYLYGNECKWWHSLRHVCQKWRNVIFGSPHRLNLHLHCTARTPVKKMLHIWPPFPIIIDGSYCSSSSIDNIIAALGQNDRICEITFGHISSSLWESVLAVTQRPFPALTRLHLESKDETVPLIPDSFLNGSAPRLRSLSLDGIPFPGLPKLLLSVTHLVNLDLSNIPHSGYIAPVAMVTALSTLTRLESLSINFQSPRSRPNKESWCLPLSTRSVLPALTELRFTGVSEYLEDLVRRIDAPLLNILDIRFYLQLEFDTPQLAEFINRTLHLKPHDEARVVLSDSGATVSLPQTFDDRGLELGISCREIDWQLSSLAQVCRSCFHQAVISAVEHLYIFGRGLARHHREDDIESSQWVELLLPFTAVKNLYLSKEFAPRIVLALTGHRAMGVLPSLEYLHLEAPPICSCSGSHQVISSHCRTTAFQSL
jgi:hypothetical protein